jgi:hypothetical protein
VTSQTFNVPVADNPGVYEGDETVNLALSTPTGGASLGGQTSAVLTITENDPVPPSGRLEFSAATYTVTENGVSALITVDRVGGSFGPVGVSYATNDGSATLADGDYTVASGTLSFANGVMSQTFNVSIADNPGTYEGDETVNLSLGTPTGGASLGTQTSAVLTITENDPIPPSGRLEFSESNHPVTVNCPA